MKNIAKIAGGFVLLFCIFILFFPIKFAKKLEDINGSYFICIQTLTTGPNWRLIGDATGYFPQSQQPFIIIYGVEPNKILNSSVQIDSPNTYIIYGTLLPEENLNGEVFPVIHSTGFDIIAPIIRGNSIRVFVPEAYLTILDFNF